MKQPLKRFIVRKYIMATSAQDAIRKDKKAKPDDIWLDSEWQKLQDDVTRQIGF